MYSFSFDYVPFIAIIGDIIESKKLNDRSAVQDQLNRVLCEINTDYCKDISSRFMITLGDEFQGLLSSGAHTMDIISKIEREMYPTKIRFGIGVGKITTDINANIPLGADGPAYYYARKMINELKATEKKKMEPKLDVKILIGDNTEISELINTIFSLNYIFKTGWTARQREIINSYVKNSGTQSEVANKLGINQSNVQKALSNSNYYAYQRALDVVSAILTLIKDGNNV